MKNIILLAFILLSIAPAFSKGDCTRALETISVPSPIVDQDIGIWRDHGKVLINNVEYRFATANEDAHDQLSKLNPYGKANIVQATGRFVKWREGYLFILDKLVIVGEQG